MRVERRRRPGRDPRSSARRSRPPATPATDGRRSARRRQHRRHGDPQEPLHDEGRVDLLDALGAALDGDGGPLLDLYEAHKSWETSIGITIGPNAAIRCADLAGFWEGLTEADNAALRDEIERVAPRLGTGPYDDPTISWRESCWIQPLTESRLPVPVDAAGAPMLVVVGATGDVATPIEAARQAVQRPRSGRADHRRIRHPRRPPLCDVDDIVRRQPVARAVPMRGRPRRDLPHRPRSPQHRNVLLEQRVIVASSTLHWVDLGPAVADVPSRWRDPHEGLDRSGLLHRRGTLC